MVKTTVGNIENVAVIGGGLMGKAIAFVFSAKFNVAVYDIAPMDIRKGVSDIVQELVDFGSLSKEDLDERLNRIQLVNEMDNKAIAEADLVVESVFEDMDLKKSVFVQLEKICRDDCIFCTNTSVMSPSEISRDIKLRERFVGMHFWNPAHLIPLVEVIMSDASDASLAQAMVDLLISLGKKAILCKKDVPGFIGNRLQVAIWREAAYMVEQGIADAKTIDDACKYGPGLRWPVLGPLENNDLIGLDLTYNIQNYLNEYLADNHKPSGLLTQLKENGDIGMKSGKGWMEWTPEQSAAVSNKLRKHLIGLTAKKED